MTKEKTTRSAKVGTHRGNPRLWFEGRWLLDAGFKPGDKFALKLDGKRIVLTAGKGDRTISRKRKGADLLPVIDICNPILDTVLDGAEQVTVTVRPGRLIIEAV